MFLGPDSGLTPAAQVRAVRRGLHPQLPASCRPEGEDHFLPRLRLPGVYDSDLTRSLVGAEARGRDARDGPRRTRCAALTYRIHRITMNIHVHSASSDDSRNRRLCESCPPWPEHGQDDSKRTHAAMRVQ